MTDYEISQYADQKIDRIRNEIENEQLRKLFDDPIDSVFRQIEWNLDPPIDNHKFNEIITNLTEKLYTRALHKIVPNSDFLTEAIELLDAYYQGLYANGYVAALMDVNDREKGGIYYVLSALAEAVKRKHRTAYIKSVFAMHYAVSDWLIQQKITENLLQRHHAYLPPSLRNVLPARIRSQVPVIVQCYVFCRHTYEKGAVSILRKK